MLGRVSSLCWTRDAKDGSRLECGLSWDPWLYFTVLNDTHSPRAICLDGYRVPFATRTTEQKGPRNSFHFTAKPFLWRFLKVCLPQRGVVVSTSGGKAGPLWGGSTTNPHPQETPQLRSPGRSKEHPRPPAWLGPCLDSTELPSPWSITHLQLHQGSVNLGGKPESKYYRFCRPAAAPRGCCCNARAAADNVWTNGCVGVQQISSDKNRQWTSRQTVGGTWAAGFTPPPDQTFLKHRDHLSRPALCVQRLTRCLEHSRFSMNERKERGKGGGERERMRGRQGRRDAGRKMSQS